MDWSRTGRLTLNRGIGNGLTDWIVNVLVPEWCEVGSLGLIGLDWDRIGTELTSDWQSIGVRLSMDWHGLAPDRLRLGDAGARVMFDRHEIALRQDQWSVPIEV